MPIVKRSVELTCKIEDAFEYVADWNNLKAFMPIFMEIKPTSMVQYGPGTSLECTVFLGKVEITTDLDLVEFAKNKRILYKSVRGLRSKMIWDFVPVGHRTQVTFSFEWELPATLVSRESEKEAMQKDIQELANQSMDLLKWTVESQSQT